MRLTRPEAFGKEVILQVEDEGADQSTALNATVKLIEQGVPAIIGSYFSTNDSAVAPQVLKRRCVLCQRIQHRDCRTWQPVYLANSRDGRFYGPIMANIVVDTLGLSKPAVFYCTAAATTLLGEQVIKALSERGIEVNMNSARRKAIQLHAIVTQIMAADIDSLILLGVSETWAAAFACSWMPPALTCQDWLRK